MHGCLPCTLRALPRNGLEFQEVPRPSNSRSPVPDLVRYLCFFFGRDLDWSAGVIWEAALALADRLVAGPRVHPVGDPHLEVVLGLIAFRRCSAQAVCGRNGYYNNREDLSPIGRHCRFVCHDHSFTERPPCPHRCRRSRRHTSPPHPPDYDGNHHDRANDGCEQDHEGFEQRHGLQILPDLEGFSGRCFVT